LDLPSAKWLLRPEHAFAAYRDALKEYTRERVPRQWASSLGEEGVGLSLLAKRTNDTAMAQMAIR
jgi:hypothetical protein